MELPASKKNTATWAHLESLATDHRFAKSAKTSTKIKSAKVWVAIERAKFFFRAFQSVSEDSRLCVVGGRVEDNSGGYLMASLSLPLDSHPFTCARKTRGLAIKAIFFFQLEWRTEMLCFSKFASICFVVLLSF